MKDIQLQHTFTLPTDPLIPIWRYMSISKLKDLVQTSSLHFTRLDKFQDQYEGYVNSFTNKVIDEMFREYDNGTQLSNNLKWTLEQTKGVTFVNCWHMNYEENAFMWKQYTEETSGVVIKSNAQKLMDSFKETGQGFFHLQPIEYTDTINDEIDLTHLRRLMNVKQTQFANENELRISVLYSLGPIDPNDSDRLIIDAPEQGIKVPVDLTRLVDEIYIHPKATEQDYGLLKGILMKQVGLDLKRSIIAAQNHSDQ